MSFLVAGQEVGSLIVVAASVHQNCDRLDELRCHVFDLWGFLWFWFPI